MIKQELYNKTVDILVQAYFNDTLKHGDCRACVVGNILTPMAEENNIVAVRWANTFFTRNMRGVNKQLIAGEGQYIGNNFLFGYIIYDAVSEEDYQIVAESRKLINLSGYSVSELAAVEYAFETAPKGFSDDEWMFNGLMAVIEVLDQIHENTDTEVTTASKQRFVKAV